MSDVSDNAAGPAQAAQAQIPPSESLKNPTFIISLVWSIIAAGTIAAVFKYSGPEVQNVVAGSVIGGVVSAVTGYYFGAAKHAAPTSSVPAPTLVKLP